MAGSKRLREVIDLTGEDETRQPKAPRRADGLSGPTPRISVLASHLSRDSFQNPRDADGEPEPVDLTQSDGPAHEFYGALDSKTVGIRFYTGYASPNERVLCKREPSNPYDSNAIRVDNVQGTQIGHIPRTVAAKLAPYLDANDISIEAILTGEKGFYDCPIRILIYGASDILVRTQLETRLKNDKLLKATQLKQSRAQNEQARRAMDLKSGRGSAGLTRSGSDPDLLSVEQLAQASQAVAMRSGDDLLQSMAMSEEQLSAMPLAAQPPMLRATLLPYQLQGLEWLRAKENPQFPKPGSGDAVQLWKRDARGRYVNIATNFTVQAAPELLSGGILADDMGLGKTLQMISLIMTGGPGCTLIIAPVSVMSNWEQQIQRHVFDAHAPRVLVYHGATRGADLKNYGVVITSYGTLSSEVGRGPLFQTDWRRVVLDEGHTIRNHKTKMAEAACLLRAKSRWVLTGTPIINSIRDLLSVLKFLRITGGIEQPEIFQAAITRPLASGERTAEMLVQSLMADLCLRRKKSLKFIDLNLPPKTEYIHRITFWPDEQTKYDALLSEAKGALEEYQKKSKKGQKGRFQSVLERLLRLRQTCNHWTLCRERIADLLELLGDENALVALTPKNRALLQQALQLYIESQEECAVCIDSLKQPVITACKHVFCRPCIARVIEVQGKCPMCRAELAKEHLLEPAPECNPEEDERLDPDTKSSKTEALLKIVQATLRKNDASKIIIFSQWTSFLTVIQRQLEEGSYGFTRIDGSMTVTQRDAAIKALDTDPDTRILLASLAVCSVGLNLVSADTVILADSWWAPAIEDQAVDRVHRLGQTRPTTVWRLVMEGTVEERVLDVQAEKRDLVSKAFREDGSKKGKTKETRMGDILKLLS
ncbi:hypothetical protein GQ53DRAFT_747953 [Thozetella sp. PMI_491]|nr:hypothetical protein GQ53DRAFT_747953 [Thozetella sp. PMI_491]